METTKITKEQLSDLHEKGASLDPQKFDFGKLSHSGRHIADVEEEVV